MNVALIDMGSNSIRLAVYKVEQKDFEPIFSKRYMTGLAKLCEREAVDRSGCGSRLVLCCWMQNLCWNSFQLTRQLFFATASLRNIKNTEAVVATIQQKTGYTVQISFRTRRSLFRLFWRDAWCTDGRRGTGRHRRTAARKSPPLAADGQLSWKSMPVGALRLHTEMVEKFLPKEAECAQIQERVICGSGRKSKRTNCRTMICSVPLAEQLVQFCS